MTRLRGLAMAVLTFAMFMDLMDVTIVNVALPAIQEDLGSTPSQLEWIVSGYVLAFAGVLITSGRLGDRYGRQRVFIAGITGFTIASLTASIAQNGETLVASRVAQGLFAGLMVPQVLASVQVLYKPRERAKIFAVIGVITAMAAVIGPVLGGWLVTNNPLGGGWRAIFFINIPIGIIIVIAAVFLVPNSKSERPSPLDPLGVLWPLAASCCSSTRWWRVASSGGRSGRSC
jgi:MFS family permease